MRAMLDKGAVFVRFGAIDYKGHVFVNGHYLGSHEGFFAPFEFECAGVLRKGENVLLVKVENDAIYLPSIHVLHTEPEATGADAIAAAARQVAETLDLAAIVCWTSSGSTGMRVSRERPQFETGAAPAIPYTESSRSKNVR